MGVDVTWVCPNKWATLCSPPPRTPTQWPPHAVLPLGVKGVTPGEGGQIYMGREAAHLFGHTHITSTYGNTQKPQGKQTHWQMDTLCLWSQELRSSTNCFETCAGKPEYQKINMLFSCCTWVRVWKFCHLDITPPNILYNVTVTLLGLGHAEDRPVTLQLDQIGIPSQVTWLSVSSSY